MIIRNYASIVKLQVPLFSNYLEVKDGYSLLDSQQEVLTLKS